MKLVIAIVQDYDVNQLLSAVTQVGFRATRIGSTGGFLRVGNTTLLMGVEEHHVGRVLRIIEANCRERTEAVQPEVIGDIHEWYPPDLVEVTVGGATVFVLPVAKFEQI